MPFIVKKYDKEFTPAPEGLHPAVCCDVVDLGMLPSPWGNQRKCELRWQIEEVEPESKKPFLVSQRFSPFLGDKSKLRPLLEGWRGRKFTEEELKGFDLESLLGINCQLQIIHNVTEKGTYANVHAVLPAPRGQCLVPNGYERVCERKGYVAPVIPGETTETKATTNHETTENLPQDDKPEIHFDQQAGHYIIAGIMDDVTPRKNKQSKPFLVFRISGQSVYCQTMSMEQPIKAAWSKRVRAACEKSGDYYWMKHFNLFDDAPDPTMPGGKTEITDEDVPF